MYLSLNSTARGGEPGVPLGVGGCGVAPPRSASIVGCATSVGQEREEVKKIDPTIFL
jgi:hypothetical protein